VKLSQLFSSDFFSISKSPTLESQKFHTLKSRCKRKECINVEECELAEYLSSNYTVFNLSIVFGAGKKFQKISPKKEKEKNSENY
jgi:hypothetical protein